MLANAGIAFEAVAARIDERAVEAPLAGSGLDGAAIAAILAAAKADEVSARFPGRHVIGCDQTLEFEGELLHKPADMDAARRRLIRLSGKTHHLHSAVCLLLEGETLWSHVETCAIRFRPYDAGFVGRHLAQVGEAALSSVGAYQIEGRGIELIQSIEGDFFSIVGLPLLPLLAELRRLELMDR